MIREGDKGKMLSRRAALLAGGQLFATSVLLSRLYYLQVLQADRYKTLAEENRISTRLLSPPRGLIYDRFGTLLAKNSQNFRVSVISEQTDGDLNASLEALNEILPLTQSEIARVRKDRYGIPGDFHKTLDIHVHFPEGAVPKDGPSAGVTLVTALVSRLAGIPVRRDVAMTGEVTLSGKVLAIGGLREKTMAAYKSGIRRVLIPKDN